MIYTQKMNIDQRLLLLTADFLHTRAPWQVSFKEFRISLEVQIRQGFKQILQIFVCIYSIGFACFN